MRYVDSYGSCTLVANGRVVSLNGVGHIVNTLKTLILANTIFGDIN